MMVLALVVQAQSLFSFESTPGKLPKEVLPIQYTVHLIPNLPENSFAGTETVDIEVLKPSARIVLNVDNLDIDFASLSGGDGAEQTLNPMIDKVQQTLTFRLAAPLAPGRYRLTLKFRGLISGEARGLFAMNYKVGQHDKTMLATHLQPTDARRLLPTWDEPAFRARFQLTVDLPAGFLAYSNTPVQQQETLPNGWQRFAFGVTPSMPSYLMALVAGELSRISAQQDGVEVGVVTTEGKQESARFALGATQDLLHYYNQYFGVPYPLPKLDQIAIPGGFNGAMENWGSIIYNEASLLYDAKKSTDLTRQTSFVTNAHELAHMWFGNLVTMAWWDNLWLNEGFATWMSTKATDHFYPAWHIWLDRMVEREGVMSLDSLKTTHPIQTPVQNEEQAAGAFDQITYGKGEAFLHMLESYLGADVFQQGVRAYMRQHQYANTTSADLWNALEQASGKPVRQLAAVWTTQPGFPLVTVTQRCERGERFITLSQEPFWLDEKPAARRLWPIPIQLGLANGKPDIALLSEASATLVRPDCEGTLVVDPDSVGYYRVKYDPVSFRALTEQLPNLPDKTRAKLLTDTWAFVMADRLPLASYLSLANQYREEPRLAIWGILMGKLGTLLNMAADQPERKQLQQYTHELVAAKLKALGWDEQPQESAEDRQLRAMLARVLALSGDETVIAEARARFERFLVNPDSLSPSLLDFVMLVVGRYASTPVYEELKGLALAAQSSEERNRYRLALSAPQDPALAARSLQGVLSPSWSGELGSMMVPHVAGNGHIDQAWMFAVLNRDALMKLQGAIGRNRYFPSIVGSSSDSLLADMLEEYVEDNFGADALVDARRTGAVIRIRSLQKARLLPQVSAALKASSPVN